jgi:hypothetical protein
MRNNLSRCLIGENSYMLAYGLPTSRFGTGTLNKRDSYVIMTPDLGGNDGTYYFFDKQTFILLGYKQHTNGEPISYSDFRQVGEAVIPFKEYEYNGGEYPFDTIRSIEKLDLDLPIDAKEFAIDPPVYANLHATTLREKRPDLYKSGGSVLGALLTGTLEGLAGGASSPILDAGNQQAAQLRALGDQIAARRASENLANLAVRSSSTAAPSLSPSPISAPQVFPVFDKSQLQMLQGLVQANSSDGNGQDAASALMIGILQGLGGQDDSPIPAAGNQQAAAIRATGDANAAQQQAAAQQRTAAQRSAQQTTASNPPSNPQNSASQTAGAVLPAGHTPAPLTDGNASGSGGSGSSGGNSGTYLAPIAQSCVREFWDPKFYNWLSFENDCGQAINLTWIAKSPSDHFGAANANIASGQSTNTGWSQTEVAAKGDFALFICPAGSVAVDGNTHQMVSSPNATYGCKKQ